jgi:hypothetical protein
MALDISFISDFHRNLYQAAPQNNEEAAREAWKGFSSTHGEWQRYADHWIKSRAAGSGPLKLGIPWINYPGIDFLKHFLKGKSTAFEWGMGGSTIFLRRYVPTVISVEHDQKWFVEAEKAIESAQLNRFRLRNLVPRYVRDAS